MAGISNEEIVKYFEKITDIDLKKNFIGVFPSNLYYKIYLLPQNDAGRKKKISVHYNEHR